MDMKEADQCFLAQIGRVLFCLALGCGSMMLILAAAEHDPTAAVQISLQDQ
jgi:hypothetical protein